MFLNLTILLGIVDFRIKLGLQTVLLTATLPKAIANRIAAQFGLQLMIVGDGELADDDGLRLRETNRQVEVQKLELEAAKKDDGKKLDWGKLDEKLRVTGRKRIYFANTVEQIQETYDRLVQAGLAPDSITVLHNRMPRSQRRLAENEANAPLARAVPKGIACF